MKRLGIIIVILMLVIGLYGCNLLDNKEDEQKTEIISADSNTVEATGEIDCKEKRSVSLDFPIYVDVLKVKEGDKVKKYEQLLKNNPNRVLEKRKNTAPISYMNYNYIISEVDGVIYNLKYQVGDYVPAYEKIFEIADTTTMYVKANVGEEFIKDIKVNARVDIVPRADKSKTYKGKVTEIAAMSIQKNGEAIIPVYINIDKVDSFLKPGFSVDVSIVKK